MPQTILPFKLEITTDTITPHAGLALFGEFFHGLDLVNHIDTHLPKPGSVRGYAPSAYILPLTLMLHGGGRSLEDTRQIRRDRGLCKLLGITRVPSPDATGDWLRRMGNGAGLNGLGKLNNLILRRALHLEGRKQYTLDIDASQIVAEKRDAHYTYKGERGYMPMLGHLGENGYVIGDEFREGNIAPAAKNMEFIKYCISKMPKGKKISHLRADSATYQAEVFNYCESHGIEFAIGGRLDSATKSAIKQIKDEEWRPYSSGHGGEEIATTVHCMEKTHKAFTLIVLRRPVQKKLFVDGGETEAGERYRVIATNKSGKPENILTWYNQRGDSSENRIKDLKRGFGMERMPCGDFGANSMFFRIGVLAYNLFLFFKRCSLPQSMQKNQIQTLRWRLYQAAGRITKHGGALYLKVSNCFYELFEEIRSKLYEVLMM